MRLTLIILLVAASLSCSEDPVYSPPSDLLPESIYLEVMIDLQLFNALVQSADSVVNQDSLRLELFEHYQVDEERFLESHAYYQSRPMEHKIRLDTVTNRLQRVLEELNEVSTSTNSSSDNSQDFQ